MMPPPPSFHIHSLECVVVNRQPPSSDKSLVRLLSTLAAAALTAALAMAGGCQNQDFGNPRKVNAGMLEPPSVQQYAQQRGISNDQARHELQQKVSQHDEDQAVENIDTIGTKQP
jgi:hypothetical protein